MTVDDQLSTLASLPFTVGAGGDLAISPLGGFAVSEHDGVAATFALLDDLGSVLDVIAPSGDPILDLQFDPITGDLFLLRSADSNSSNLLRISSAGDISTFATYAFPIGGGADLAVSVVPEPSTAALGLLGIVVIAACKLRRRRNSVE